MPNIEYTEYAGISFALRVKSENKKIIKMSLNDEPTEKRLKMCVKRGKRCQKTRCVNVSPKGFVTIL